MKWDQVLPKAGTAAFSSSSPPIRIWLDRITDTLSVCEINLSRLEILDKNIDLSCNVETSLPINSRLTIDANESMIIISVLFITISCSSWLILKEQPIYYNYIDIFRFFNSYQFLKSDNVSALRTKIFFSILSNSSSDFRFESNLVLDTWYKL